MTIKNTHLGKGPQKRQYDTKEWHTYTSNKNMGSDQRIRSAGYKMDV